MSSCVQSEPSAVSSPPQPLETLAPAAENRATTWPKPNEGEAELGPQSLSAGAGLKTDGRTEEKRVLIVVNFSKHKIKAYYFTELPLQHVIPFPPICFYCLLWALSEQPDL